MHVGTRPPPAVLDYFETVRTYPTFKRFTVGELLVAQYTCPIREPTFSMWSHTDHVVHVLSGTKTWRTQSGTWTTKAGDTVFFKKGAYVLRQSFEENFCVLMFFTPDAFVRDVAQSLRDELPPRAGPALAADSVIPLAKDASLAAFLHSMAAYFAHDDKPPEPLLRLKLRELITGILLSERNGALRAYFRALACADAPSLPAIMEANFCHNLSLAEFARMCHRSLASFKRKFAECYGMPPGRWLLERRLERAARLLGSAEMSVTEIALECGFESPAHFSRAFRQRYRCSPREYRERAAGPASPTPVAVGEVMGRPELRPPVSA